MVDWKSAFVGAIVIIVLAILFGYVSPENTWLSYVAAFIGGLVAGYLATGTMGADAVNGFVAGAIAFIISFIILIALLGTAYGGYGYGLGDLFVALLPALIIGILIEGIVAAVGAIVGHAIIPQKK